MKKNLTLRYSATQFTYWAATSATAFATTYLLSKGIPSGTIGLLLALAGLLSCLTQPMLASFADRSEKFLLIKLLLMLSLLCGVCFLLQLVGTLPGMLSAVLYGASIWAGDAMVPLLNALSVAYNGAGYSVNYGAGRGVGCVATAVSSLVIGVIIARFGTVWMLLLFLLARIGCILSLSGYPKIQKGIPERKEKQKTCSISFFFSHYRVYCVSLLGIAFLGMDHSMTENYLIAIVGALGGDSSHVGTALFISAMAAFPVIFFFDKIRARFRDTTLLKIAALTYLVRAICFYFARNIGVIYLLQLLQMTSFAFLAPTQVYYAKAKVREYDMVKGQAFITAAYALGCSAGNFIGGQLLVLGVPAVLAAGILMALAGTLILFATVNKSDKIGWITE